jgi:hypothetical protein
VGLICGILLWPAGLTLNPLALRRIKRSGTAGRGLAIAGFVLSIFGTALTVFAILAVVAVQGVQDRAAQDEAHQAQSRDA